MPKYVVLTPIKGVDTEVGKQVDMSEKDAKPLLACGALGDPVSLKEAAEALKTPVKDSPVATAAADLAKAADNKVTNITSKKEGDSK